MRKLLFLMFLLMLGKWASATTIGLGVTQTITSGSRIDMGCIDYHIQGTLVVEDNAVLQNVRNLSIAPGGVVDIQGYGSKINVGAWENNGEVVSSFIQAANVFSMNTCITNTVKGSSDTDRDGIPDGEDGICQIGGQYGFLNPNFSCPKINNAKVASIPAIGTFNLMLLVLLLPIITKFVRRRSSC